MTELSSGVADCTRLDVWSGQRRCRGQRRAADTGRTDKTADEYSSETGSDGDANANAGLTAEWIGEEDRDAKYRQDKLMTGMRVTTDQWLDQVASQMQEMVTMICRLVSSVVFAPHHEHLPGQDPPQRPTRPNPTGNRPSNANRGFGRLRCFECGQMGHLAKECSRKALVHLNYRGPGKEQFQRKLCRGRLTETTGKEERPAGVRFA